MLWLGVLLMKGLRLPEIAVLAVPRLNLLLSLRRDRAVWLLLGMVHRAW